MISSQIGHIIGDAKYHKHKNGDIQKILSYS